MKANKEVNDPEKIFILTKRQVFNIYVQGEDNIDCDGCEIDDSIENFEEIIKKYENKS